MRDAHGADEVKHHEGPTREPLTAQKERNAASKPAIRHTPSGIRFGLAGIGRRFAAAHMLSPRRYRWLVR